MHSCEGGQQLRGTCFPSSVLGGKGGVCLQAKPKGPCWIWRADRPRRSKPSWRCLVEACTCCLARALVQNPRPRRLVDQGEPCSDAPRWRFISSCARSAALGGGTQFVGAVWGPGGDVAGACWSGGGRTEGGNSPGNLRVMEGGKPAV
ncbi:hypothetical protein KIL84_014749 [Mauremys mutica]|uniref:Uncharacterized protein n=1 Tax=Mauremys mutica TaxID=74926 RepID=A0A9D3XRM8_9SAUR|nr:hypothetical protein KIL84_014749 [Mauremys mutica]